MTDVERAHLRATTAAGRRHGEAHLVVDIHERQRAGRVRARTGHIRAARPQRREFIADAAAGLQREPGFVHLAEDVIHRITDGAGHGAVDRRGGRLVFLRAGVRSHAPRWNGATAQRPQEAFVPVFAVLFALDIGQCAGDTLVRIVHGLVDRLTRLGDEPVLLVPDVERGILERNGIHIFGLELDHGIHAT